ncbi:hypothetical protein ASE36_01455 [Rhizobium sp. Root274]|nr:hypothetical protein ASE36_01455 [Rhizobium sp. Root274]
MVFSITMARRDLFFVVAVPRMRSVRALLLPMMSREWRTIFDSVSVLSRWTKKTELEAGENLARPSPNRRKRRREGSSSAPRAFLQGRQGTA